MLNMHPLSSSRIPTVSKGDEKITATLACSVPFDIDDNPEDDTQSAYYKSESLLAVSSNDVGWIVGVAGLVLVVAWLLGAIQAPKPPTPKPSTGKGEARTNVNEEVQPQRHLNRSMIFKSKRLKTKPQASERHQQMKTWSLSPPLK